VLVISIVTGLSQVRGKNSSRRGKSQGKLTFAGKVKENNIEIM